MATMVDTPTILPGKRSDRKSFALSGGALTRHLQKELQTKCDNEELAYLGLSQHEVDEALNLFKDRLRSYWTSTTPSTPSSLRSRLSIEDVDMVLRQLKVFVPLRYILALFHEADMDNNGWVDQEEFLMMVSKLRGRTPLSKAFYVSTVSREMHENYCKIFQILDSDEDGRLDEAAIVTGCRQIHPHIREDSEDFRRVITQASDGANEPGRFEVEDFLALQARLKGPPICLEAARYSLTEEEVERYETVFTEWKSARESISAQELRSFLHSVGVSAPWHSIRECLEELGLDTIISLEARQFVYLVVGLGASTCVRRRKVLKPDATYSDAFREGFALEELWELGWDDVKAIRSAGWSASEVYRANLADAAGLKEAGYGASELRHLGLSALTLRFAGFSLDELRNAGFGTEVIRECARLSGSASRPSTATNAAAALTGGTSGPL